MACGLCVVSTDVGGMPDLVDDGENGILVPPADSAAMAEGVRQILADPLLAAKLSGNARRKAESLDWSVLLPRWERLLREAADGVKAIGDRRTRRPGPGSSETRSCRRRSRFLVQRMMRRLRYLEEAQWWEPERIEAERRRALINIDRGCVRRK